MTKIDNQIVETISCVTAKEFISTLRIIDEYWLPEGYEDPPWLFRGQADATWDLTPSAWREPAQKLKERVLAVLKEPIEELFSKYHNIMRSQNIDNLLLQTIFEIEVIRFFNSIAEQHAFTIPRNPGFILTTSTSFDLKEEVGYCFEFFRRGSQIKPFNYPLWSSKTILPVIALAQHHGVPTSLLDWTQKPLTAAFFAAYDYLKYSNKPPEHLAVWAIHKSLIGEAKRLRQVRLVRSEMSYLHAQDGVLIYDGSADYDFIVQGKWPHVEHAVRNTIWERDHKPLRKITMPASQVYDLLRLLRIEGITLPSLMPVLDNISPMMKQQWPPL